MAVALVCAVMVPASASAQLDVIISGGFSAAYAELLPEFERSTGIPVTTGRGGSIGDSPRAIPNQIRRGVPADVVILARQGLDLLIDEHYIVAGSDVDLADSVIGMVVRTGAAKPDIGTADALRQALLQAESVAVSSSTSGRYLTTELFPRLGIAEAMVSKTIITGATAVGRGEAELGFQQVSEILPIEGADFVAALPAELQYTTTYAAAVIAGSEQSDSARSLIDFLSSEAAAAAIENSGMQPAGRR